MKIYYLLLIIFMLNSIRASITGKKVISGFITGILAIISSFIIYMYNV